MLFVVDKPRLQRIIAITRDDRRPKDQTNTGPFFRIEASGDHLRLTGHQVESKFPATALRNGKLVQKCLDAKGQNCQAWEKEIDERVAALYGL